MGQRRYQTHGFIPFVSPPARVTREADTDNIVKGDALHDDGAGYATNAIAAFANTFLGIAAADCDNSAAGASKGDKSVEIYPFDHKTLYIVPVASNALSAVIDRDDVGIIVDLENNDDIDLEDTITTGIGFFIEDFDGSAEAIVANAMGYAIGRFKVQATQASAA